MGLFKSSIRLYNRLELFSCLLVSFFLHIAFGDRQTADHAQRTKHYRSTAHIAELESCIDTVGDRGRQILIGEI
jgi:hypothetical protein